MQNDDFDIDYLRKVDFSQVDELEPNAQEGFHLALQKTMMVHLELDPLSTEIDAQVETDEPLVLKIYL